MVAEVTGKTGLKNTLLSLQTNLKWARMIHDFKYLYKPLISYRCLIKVKDSTFHYQSEISTLLLTHGVSCHVKVVEVSGIFTNISGCSTCSRHHAARALDFRQTKVTDHDLGVFIHAVVEQVLWLWWRGKRTTTGNVTKVSSHQSCTFTVLSVKPFYNRKLQILRRHVFSSEG